MDTGVFLVAFAPFGYNSCFVAALHSDLLAATMVEKIGLLPLRQCNTPCVIVEHWCNIVALERCFCSLIVRDWTLTKTADVLDLL